MCNFRVFRVMKKAKKTKRKRWKNKSWTSKSWKSKSQILVMGALILKTENVIKQLLFIHLVVSVALHTCYSLL